MYWNLDQTGEKLYAQLQEDIKQKIDNDTTQACIEQQLNAYQEYQQ